jgi:hypothetical protein
MNLPARRAANLTNRIVDLLAEAAIEPPLIDELERAYTARCLAPIVQSVLNDLPGAGLRLRGDGCTEQAVPARVLNVEFFPDLAVSLGAQYIWAAEVKFVRSTNRQNSIDTAIGQATLYRSRYEHSSVVLIDIGNHHQGNLKAFTDLDSSIGIRVVVRSKFGRTLLPSRVKRPEA